MHLEWKFLQNKFIDQFIFYYVLVKHAICGVELTNQYQYIVVIMF